jgi:flavorubredoxin
MAYRVASMARRKPDLTWTYDRPLRRAVVVYDSPHGKTRKVAEALAEGIRAEDVLTDVVPIDEAMTRSFVPYDLIAVGSPNAWAATSPGVRRLLKVLGGLPSDGRYAFAFDLHTRGHLDGAASEIAHAFGRLKLRVPMPPKSGVVQHATGGRGKDAEGTYRLKGGTEAEFQALGRSLVRTIRNELAASFD